MTTDLGMRARLHLPFPEVLTKIIEALKTEGFGVLTEIDVQATLKQKLNVDFRQYRILGACNPPLAHRALSANLDVGLLLPATSRSMRTATVWWSRPSIRSSCWGR